MTNLPNPFDSGASPSPPDEAAASVASQPPVDAAADIPEPSVTERRTEEAPASGPQTVTVAAGDAGATNHIGEIFVGAEKLNDPEARFVLDVHAFMDAIDEAPLFLRRFG